MKVQAYLSIVQNEQEVGLLGGGRVRELIPVFSVDFTGFLDVAEIVCARGCCQVCDVLLESPDEVQPHFTVV